MPSRRDFLSTSALAFLGLQRCLADPSSAATPRFGPLKADPDGILNLPEGFTYRVISRQGTRMADGYRVPGTPDGMAAFPGPDGKVILVRNHELGRQNTSRGPFEDNTRLPEAIDEAYCFDSGDNRETPDLGGTSNLVFDPKTGACEKEFLSLIGTDRNCAGGAMPWGSWITCEEPANLTDHRGTRHGWCFEVKATDEVGLQKPVPLKALGRFRHEAVALDPKTGILYLTEDRNDGIFYRFVPETPQDFSKGKLQALAIVGEKSADLRNYSSRNPLPKVGQKLSCTWIDLEEIDSPNDDLRFQGFDAGAARFARGEGIHYGEGSLYICCTDGGPDNRGQIFKLTPGETGDELELFLQPSKSDLLNNGDNLCVAPWGGLVVCEDLINGNFAKHTCVRYVSPEGKIETIAENAKDNSEFAGSCFSPDGQWLFVNLQHHGLTLAITGPWKG